MILQHRILASWTIPFFVFRLCMSVTGTLIHTTDEPLWGHNTGGHVEALSNFHDDAYLNLASGSNHDHQTVDHKLSKKRVVVSYETNPLSRVAPSSVKTRRMTFLVFYFCHHCKLSLSFKHNQLELDTINSQRSPIIDANVEKKSGLGRSVSEADMLSIGISSGKKEVSGLCPVTTGRKFFRASLLDIPGTTFGQRKSVAKDPMSVTISPTSVLDVSSDSENEKASSPTMSAAGQHINHMYPSSKSFESMITKESASGSSSPGINTLSNEAVAPKLNVYSIDPLEKTDDIEGSVSERHGRLRLYLPRPNLVKAPPPSQTPRLRKGPGILDDYYDKLYEKRAVISSLTKRILDIVVLDWVTLDSKFLPIFLELKTLLINVGEKLSNLRQYTFVRLYVTFSVWQESRKKAMEILEKVSIIYLESMNQLKDTSEVVHAHKDIMSQKFLRMMKQEFLEFGLGRFKSHVNELMRQVEDVAPREFGKRLDPLDISLDAHDQASFRNSILGLKELSKPVEIEHVHRDLDFMVGARVAGVLIIGDMPAQVGMLQRVVDTPRSSTSNDFEALEENLLEFKESLRTSFTLMAWGFAHNLPPSSLENLLDDSMALNRILKNLRHILDVHPLHPRGIGKPAPDYDDIGDFIAETLVKSISKGSKILLARLKFMSQEGFREPTGLHWFWEADGALDYFPHHLLPEQSYQRSVSFKFSSGTQEEFGKCFEKFLDLYDKLLNKRPLLEFSETIFSERSDLIKKMIKANKDIISLVKQQFGFSMSRYILRHCQLWKFCLNQVDHILQTAIQDFELLEKRALEEINVVHWSAMESLSDRIFMFRRELDNLLARDAGPISTGSIINPVPYNPHIQQKVK